MLSDTCILRSIYIKHKSTISNNKTSLASIPFNSLLYTKPNPTASVHTTHKSKHKLLGHARNPPKHHNKLRGIHVINNSQRRKKECKKDPKEVHNRSTSMSSSFSFIPLPYILLLSHRPQFEDLRPGRKKRERKITRPP